MIIYANNLLSGSSQYAFLGNNRPYRIFFSSIAFDSGFAALASFQRAFKRETGLTASEWRAMQGPNYPQRLIGRFAH